MRDIDNYEQVYATAENDFEVYQAMYRKKRVLESLRKVTDQGVIVEIGCGMDSIFNYYNEYSKFFCIEPGTKFYKALVSQRKNDSRIVLINDFFENAISQIDKEVDCIICSSLLHEIENPYEFLKLIRDIASSDTLVHINVPNAKSFHRMLAVKSGIINDIHDMSSNNVLLQQRTVFDLDKLQEMIGSVGDIEILECGSYFPKPFTHKQMKACLDNGIIERNILEGLYNMGEYMPELGSEIFIDFKWK